MNLQTQRVNELCEALNLTGIAANYAALVQEAAKQDAGYCDYLEQCLKAEQQNRKQRLRKHCKVYPNWIKRELLKKLCYWEKIQITQFWI
ncbi:ATP-binding protein [Legionella londiniensis]|uniref:Transposase/IS protein n=1 Tax=Legionella londiniensis TaxID=45068 RepID=A0A0W0VM91_9GAMM|nr:ATP-binding protein [Legionella londiniensis]KTD21220.1 transposase/IS protein [Legionella londiniensis]STX93245.1 transposase/IS protein [Legionella londiniensis]